MEMSVFGGSSQCVNRSSGRATEEQIAKGKPNINFASQDTSGVLPENTPESAV